MQHFKSTVIGLTVLAFLCSTIFPVTAPAITIKQERELGVEFMKTVRQKYTIIEDPAIADYINHLGEKIVSHVPTQPFAFHFYVIDQDTINAFAGPGAHVFVFSGLFDAMHNESELAGILSHEIAHVTCRHISDLIDKSKKTNVATLAGLIAGILIGIGGAPTAGSAMIFGSAAAGQSISLAYSREDEKEADQIGREYLEKAGYSVYGMLCALKTIRNQEWFGENQIPTYLRDHPGTTQRINYLDSVFADKKKPVLKDSYEFERARAKLIALYGRTDIALDRFSKALASDPKNPAALYGYGLALARNGQYQAAIAQIKKAIRIHHGDMYMTMDLGRIYYLAGDNARAMATMKGIPDLDICGPEGYLYIGRIYMEQKQYQKAVAAFEQLLADYSDNTDALYFLGQSYGEEGELGDAHYYLGRYYRKIGDIRNAYFHFHQALKYAKDSKRTHKIKEILKKLPKEMRRKPPSPDQNFSAAPFVTSDRNGRISW